MKKFIVAGAVVVALIVAWQIVPGLRTRARDAYGKVGGWSDKAREADPLGFMEYAEGRLEKHLASLKIGRVRIREGQTRIEDETKRNRDLLGKSKDLAVAFRASFKAAEADSAFPVAVAGSAYSRNELIEQVRLVLMQRDNYTKAISDLVAAGKATVGADAKLLRQLTDTQAALAALPAKKEIVRVNQLAGQVQELLVQIDALIDRNETVLQETPVRTVEELLVGTVSSETAPDLDVMAFLEGTE